MKKSLKSEIAKLKDNKLIAQRAMYKDVAIFEKEDETLTQLKKVMYRGRTLTYLRDSEKLKRVIAIELCKGTSPIS